MVWPRIKNVAPVCSIQKRGQSSSPLPPSDYPHSPHPNMVVVLLVVPIPFLDCAVNILAQHLRAPARHGVLVLSVLHCGPSVRVARCPHDHNGGVALRLWTPTAGQSLTLTLANLDRRAGAADLGQHGLNCCGRLLCTSWLLCHCRPLLFVRAQIAAFLLCQFWQTGRFKFAVHGPEFRRRLPDGQRSNLPTRIRPITGRRFGASRPYHE